MPASLTDRVKCEGNGKVGPQPQRHEGATLPPHLSESSDIIPNPLRFPQQLGCWLRLPRGPDRLDFLAHNSASSTFSQLNCQFGLSVVC